MSLWDMVDRRIDRRSRKAFALTSSCICLLLVAGYSRDAISQEVPCISLSHSRTNGAYFTVFSSPVAAVAVNSCHAAWPIRSEVIAATRAVSLAFGRCRRTAATLSGVASVVMTIERGKVARLQVSRGHANLNRECLVREISSIALSVPPNLSASERMIEGCACSWEHFTIDFSVRF